MKKTQKNNGITLIALVITIIVLLILATVSIATLTGKNGILTKVNIAKTKTEEEKIKEEIKLAYNSVKADSFFNGWDTNKKAEALQKELENSDKSATVTAESTNFKINYKNLSFTLNDSGEVTILENSKITINDFSIAGTKVTNITPPLGFVHVGGTIEEGYVISDEASDKDAGVDANLTGNQFVWIPVDKDQKITVDVTSEQNITSLVITDPYGDDIVKESNVGKEYKNTNLDPTINGPYRLSVTTENGELKKSFLKVHSLYAIDTLKDLQYTEEEDFMNGSNMKQYEETEDYKDKVNQNGGFYIGRYEVGDASATTNRTISSQYIGGPAVTKKNQFVFNWISQPNALAKAKAYNSNLTSSLPTGAAWDRIIGWFYETQARPTDSLLRCDSSWGHYTFLDNSFSNTQQAIRTGEFEQTKVKNIYDLQGNIAEWTTESPSDLSIYFARGGDCWGGGNLPFRLDESIYTTLNYFGFRIALYL